MSSEAPLTVRVAEPDKMGIVRLRHQSERVLDHLFAKLNGLVREDDLQQTRSYLRDVATQIGETLRAAS